MVHQVYFRNCLPIIMSQAGTVLITETAYEPRVKLNRGMIMIKRKVLALVLFAAVTAVGETFEPSTLLSIDLPDGWVEIPADVLDAFAMKTDEISPDSPAQYYDFGYQAPAEGGRWLSYPYVLIQVRDVGRIPSSELARYQKLGAEMDEFTLPDVSIGETMYDKGNQILWSTLAAHTAEGESVKALVAVKLTEIGYIRLMGCATEETFGEYKTIFKNAFSTLGIDESLAYKPQVGDAVPSVGGIKTGKVLVWFVQAVVIGGLLWAVYHFLKKKLKKA